MYQLKDYDDASIYNKWLGIVRRVTHEGAPWHSKQRSEKYVQKYFLLIFFFFAFLKYIYISTRQLLGVR